MKESHEGEARREGCLPLFMTLSFQDSEVSQVAVVGDVLRVRFSAAHVEVEPGVVGHAHGLTMVCTGARWQGDLPDCIGRMADGSLWSGPDRRSRIPWPFEATADAHLELMFENGTTLSLHADTLTFTLDDDATFTESQAC